MTKANNSISMREKNRLLILNLIRKNPISRADISRVTGLTRAAVTIITDALIDDGIIKAGETLKSESGRRPTLLYLNPDAYASIGIDISRDGCHVAFTDFVGKSIFREKIDYQERADDTVNLICDVVLSELRNHNFITTALGVCVCAPGPIDFRSGTILNPVGLELFHGYNIIDALSAKIGLPVYLEKDANVLAIAEKNSDDINTDMLLLLADHGIGCSVIKDGRIFRGRDGMGCEIGHTTIDVNGELCSCGNVGCAEIYASIPATVRRAGEKSWDALIEKAKAGDQISCEALKYQGKILTTLCVNAANLFEVESIVLGGRLAEGDFLLNPIINESLQKTAFSRRVHGYKVSSSRLGDGARAYAASIAVTEKYFNGELAL